MYFMDPEKFLKIIFSTIDVMIEFFSQVASFLKRNERIL